MRCMACYEMVPEGVESCPCCGFMQYQVIGDTKEAISALEFMANRHRSMFLRNYDLGVTVYHWKDQDGMIVLDTTTRQSFGTGDALLGKTTWLEQKFARIPDTEALTVELSVEKKDGQHRAVQVRVPMLREKQLQQLGIEMHEDLTVSLKLKNQNAQTSSEPVAFLRD